MLAVLENLEILENLEKLEIPENLEENKPPPEPRRLFSGSGGGFFQPAVKGLFCLHAAAAAKQFAVEAMAAKRVGVAQYY